MYILFAPSELKNSGGKASKFDNSKLFDSKFKDERDEVLNRYLKCLKDEKISRNFLKNYKVDVGEFDKLLIALKRYDGVAYKALNIKTLKDDETEFIANSTIVFSNLFGPIWGSDKIPYYHLKQGEILGNFNQYNFYAKAIKKSLDELLDGKIIIDLRPSFYEKIYKITSPFITFKFLKNGKTVSHFAKHYRGLVLRNIAITKPKNRGEILNISLENLKLIDIKEIKNKTELNYEIVG